MMSTQRYLLIDTETSGLFDFSKPADGLEQGRLAQLAVILCESAPEFEITRKADFYVKPNGWLMSPDASRVNGLTDEFLAEHGHDVRHVLDFYEKEILEGRTVVSFGAQFDCKVMRGEFRRASRGDLFEITNNLCIMRIMTAICRIPQKNGRGLKWPKLEEAMAHFDLPFEVTHRATNDVAAVHQLMCKINEIDMLRDGKVHRAKNYPLQ